MSGTLRALAEKARERAQVWAVAMGGELQRSLGRPITFVGTHRQAVEQCRQQLQIPAEVCGRVAITAMRNRPWIGLGVYTACVLRQLGYEATLLFRGSEIARLFPPWPVRTERFDFWKGVAGIPGIELVDLEAIPVRAADMAEFADEARAAAPATVAYDLHFEEDDVLQGGDLFQARRRAAEEHLARMGAAAKKVLTREKFHRLILYSGLIGESPALLACARRIGLTTCCLEGWAWRHGHLIFSHDAPALEYDVAALLARIQPWDSAKEAEIHEYMNFLEGGYSGASAWLETLHAVQRAKIGRALPAELRAFLAGGGRVFLAAPNVVGDSSTLQREAVLPSQRKWLTSLIERFRGRTDARLLVRAHPAEVWVKSKVSLKMADVARECARDASNIHVIGPEEKVNTLALLPLVHAGLIWMSTVGVDMVVRGVPVIAAAKPKYAGLGIVEEPATLDEFYSLLDRWIIEPPRPSPQQVTVAKQYLYVAFKAMSYPAWSTNTLLTGCRLNAMPEQAEHDAFYRALVS